MSESMSSRSVSQPLLELKDVWRSYNQGESKLDVLTGASLTVLPGEMKALVGPSGSGKSTLLNIAGLLEQPESGTVFIDKVDSGRPRQGKRTLLRREHIGFVFQFHRLLPEFSALENVMIPQMLNGLDKFEAADRANSCWRWLVYETERIIALIAVGRRTTTCCHRKGSGQCPEGVAC